MFRNEPAFEFDVQRLTPKPPAFATETECYLHEDKFHSTPWSIQKYPQVTALSNYLSYNANHANNGLSKPTISDVYFIKNIYAKPHKCDGWHKASLHKLI